jgi:hypothetical protein
LRSHTAEPLLTEDGSKIRITVTNRAPSTLEIDKIQVCLLGPGQQSVWYISDAEILIEGENEVVLTSLVSGCFGKSFGQSNAHIQLTTLGHFVQMPLSGVFTLGAGKLSIGRLSFEYGSKDQTTTLVNRIVRIPADSEAFEANLDIPLEGKRLGN